MQCLDRRVDARMQRKVRACAAELEGPADRRVRRHGHGDAAGGRQRSLQAEQGLDPRAVEEVDLREVHDEGVRVVRLAS
ncbi:MAG TPA: hypothetical protein VHF51_02860, partial [Solirubrobacteraceae bacterium]|nr:hypothetical protein [Solirubrobacteraceae bacterium]